MYRPAPSSEKRKRGGALRALSAPVPVTHRGQHYTIRPPLLWLSAGHAACQTGDYSEMLKLALGVGQLVRFHTSVKPRVPRYVDAAEFASAVMTAVDSATPLARFRKP